MQPIRVHGIPGRIASCDLSESHITVVDESSMVWIWGSNKKGELGLGDYTLRTSPFPLVGLQSKKVTDVKVGHQFSIAFKRELQTLVG